MKVRMLQQVSGTRNGVPWPAVGEECDLDPDEAFSMALGQTPIVEILEPHAHTVAEERAVAEPEGEEHAVPADKPAAKRTATRGAAAKR